ncbi:MAG: hypothetical protein F4Y86_00840 [Gammaproteobacteria bacterium]|nr:hypothetical protein [Gammaproteobacteria bacterium]
MATDHRSKLAAIRRFDQLIAYLRDELDWPIEGGDFEALTFDYTPDELGIDSRNAAKIETISRLRPLVPAQPWGIFFVKFEPKRLPVVALRRILSQVTLKARSSALASERQAWAMEDLLFVSNFGEGGTRHISFAHFAAPEGRQLPTLKVLGWDDKDTALHLDEVARELADHLAWPVDEHDSDAWRKQWRAAFSIRHREVVTTSLQLSMHLAALARRIRDRTRTALRIETKDGPIGRLMEAFKRGLLHDLDANTFADMYAQTIAYGLLSARIANPQHQTADDFAAHMRTNPLLRDLMQAFLQVGSRGGRASSGLDFDELGVSDVVELLDDANMEAVVRDFGDRNPREDPVIHFYELFLKEYDAEKRMQRGVFYTPRPVVSYIVRSIDSLLRTQYGLEDGLADTATWGEVARREGGFRIPAGVEADQDFVQILDPATGTGTFLVEVIDVIYETLVAKWQEQGLSKRRINAMWNEYVPAHLLNRLFGYELLMASYAIAHMKIGLKLYETGYRFGADERVRVFLTNALEPADAFSGQMDFAIPALADEARQVNEVKRANRFTVVLGNPPYAGHSANKGKWIAELLRGTDGREATDSYFTVDGAPLGEKNPKWLNDDYVKFMRFAQRQIELTSVGVLGFVTNHGYLENPTFRGMRESLLATFSLCHLLDLHGNSKRKERAPDGSQDENVFEIQQGVSIGLYVRGALATSKADSIRAFHADLWGSRDVGAQSKYERLLATDVRTTDWKKIAPSAGLYLFAPRDATLSAEYAAGWKLTDIFPVSSVGIVTARDKLAIQWTTARMRSTVNAFASLDIEDAREKFGLGKDSTDWKIADAQQDILDHGDVDERVVPILYRPFDIRSTYYTGRAGGFICRPRPKVMRHMLAGPNRGLSTTRSTEIRGGWEHVFVTKYVTQHHTVSIKEVNYLFPLYLYGSGVPKNGIPDRRVNLALPFLETLGSTIGLEFSSTRGEGTAADDVFNYIYAVLHSSGYRRRFASFLKSDYPRVPLPRNIAVFRDLVTLGRRLADFHAMKVLGETLPEFPFKKANVLTRVRYAPPSGGDLGRVWLNASEYFDGITPEVWSFTIGGYRPAEKWLKDRKGHALSADDIVHYKKIIAALTETIGLMAEITEAIDLHGGWPAAFQPSQRLEEAIVIPFRPPVVVPNQKDRYANCVPLIPLQAAAGAFGDPQFVEDDGHEWVAVATKHRLRSGMFVAQVVGTSMEPIIPDGSYCLFRAPVHGTRQGKTVLVQLRDATDPETGQRYTVKRYESTKAASDDSWRHATIRLTPANHAFDPIVLTDVEEGELTVIAEFLEVLHGGQVAAG